MLLELKDIKKYFPLRKGLWGGAKEFVRAVDGVDLSVAAGENLGLVGESGSGKTTLGRVILRLYSPDRGTILFEGQDWTRLSARAMRPLRANVQMVFQDPYSSLDPRYTVRGILREALHLAHVKAGEQETKMIGILKAVGLEAEVLSRFPHEFSGGERQRIAIARALVMSPKLLILDEAVSSLDVVIQAQIIELLKELQTRFAVTYLFITHNLRVVRKLCRNIAVMYKGKIIESGPAEEIFRNPLHPYTKALLAAALDYRAVNHDDSVSFQKNSRLIDHGNGHFVIN